MGSKENKVVKDNVSHHYQQVKMLICLINLQLNQIISSRSLRSGWNKYQIYQTVPSDDGFDAYLLGHCFSVCHLSTDISSNNDNNQVMVKDMHH